MLDDLYNLSLYGICKLMILVLLISFITMLFVMIPYHYYKINRNEKINKPFLKGLFIIYITTLIIITIYRFGSTLDHPTINLVPLINSIESFRLSSIDNPQMALPVLIYNVFGNIIFFIPMGYFLGVFLKSENWIKVVFLCFIISLWIEIIQYILVVGISDIDDVIFNTIGGAIGYFIYYLGNKEKKNEYHKAS